MRMISASNPSSLKKPFFCASGKVAQCMTCCGHADADFFSGAYRFGVNGHQKDQSSDELNHRLPPRMFFNALGHERSNASSVRLVILIA
jgi:hypothetical protein